MDDFLELLTDGDFIFFIDDVENAFQLQLISAQFRGQAYERRNPFADQTLPPLHVTW